MLSGPHRHTHARFCFSFSLAPLLCNNLCTRRLTTTHIHTHTHATTHARTLQGLKASLEAAHAAHAKSKDASKSAHSKAADARAARAAALRDLEQAQLECSALATELCALHPSGGRLPEGATAKFGRCATQRSLWHCAARTAAHSIPILEPRPQPQCAGAPWPRTAFSLRGGHVLHARACGDQDVSRCVTTHYEDHAQLEAYLQQQDGMVLCHACRADPGF